MATTTSMRMILLLFLPVLLISTMQVGHGAVLVINTSVFNVTVYDTNTTIIIDTLYPNQTTIFPLDTAGPDLFVVTNQNKVGSCSALVIDNQELYLSGNRKVSCKAQDPPVPPAAAPYSIAVGSAAGG